MCRAATNGAKPAKSTRQRNKPKDRAGPFTRPATAKNPRKAKRNREFPVFRGNSLYLPCLFTTYRPFGILAAAPGSGAILAGRGFRLPVIFPVHFNCKAGRLRRRGCGYLVRLSGAFVVLSESPAKTIENRVRVSFFGPVQRTYRNLYNGNRVGKLVLLHNCLFLVVFINEL